MTALWPNVPAMMACGAPESEFVTSKRRPVTRCTSSAKKFAASWTTGKSLVSTIITASLAAVSPAMLTEFGPEPGAAEISRFAAVNRDTEHSNAVAIPNALRVSLKVRFMQDLDCDNSNLPNQGTAANESVFIRVHPWFKIKVTIA